MRDEDRKKARQRLRQAIKDEDFKKILVMAKASILVTDDSFEGHLKLEEAEEEAKKSLEGLVITARKVDLSKCLERARELEEMIKKAGLEKYIQTGKL